MITEAFLHFKGIGPKNIHKIKEAGFNSWDDIIRNSADLPFGEKLNNSILEEARKYISLLEDNNIIKLTNSFHPSDKWRVLYRFFHKASFFDIETNPYNWHNPITVITCFHRGKIFKYVRGKNLEEFIDLTQEIELLVSFNGISFDVPIILNHYHIPALPCAHIDLRWIAYHNGHKGGLKSIERKLNIKRPNDLEGVDGMMAVALWDNWERKKDTKSLDLLVRYCSADSLSLYLLGIEILKEKNIIIKDTLSDGAVWNILDNS